MKTEIEHTPEFPPRPAGLPESASWMGDKEKKADQAARELAAAYSRLFSGSDDGKRVLADLVRKFDPKRSRFAGHSDAIRAAWLDGQSTVIREIQEAVATGTSSTGLPTQ